MTSHEQWLLPLRIVLPHRSMERFRNIRASVVMKSVLMCRYSREFPWARSVREEGPLHGRWGWPHSHHPTSGTASIHSDRLREFLSFNMCYPMFQTAAGATVVSVWSRWAFPPAKVLNFDFFSRTSSECNAALTIDTNKRFKNNGWPQVPQFCAAGPLCSRSRSRMVDLGVIVLWRTTAWVTCIMLIYLGVLAERMRVYALKYWSGSVQSPRIGSQASLRYFRKTTSDCNVVRGWNKLAVNILTRKCA
jgi:hypothetical protein